MRSFAIATGVFLTGLAVVSGIMVAFALGLSPNARTASPRVAMPVSHATQAGSMMSSSGAGSMMSSGSGMMTAAVSTAAPAPKELRIQHVLRGCHVWSNGQTTGAMMQLHLKPGQHLAILDEDVDAHQMIQLAGPMHLRMGRAMMMNHAVTLSFPKRGVYRLGTKTVEMPGQPMMNVKTIGPDNSLRLVVTVA
jgi:hypothetical protein